MGLTAYFMQQDINSLWRDIHTLLKYSQKKKERIGSGDLETTKWTVYAHLTF
jgi:hypothetical protein